MAAREKGCGRWPMPSPKHADRAGRRCWPSMTQPKQPPQRRSATCAMLAEAHRVTVEDLPVPSLAAYAAVEQVPDAYGGRHDRVDRRGQLRYDKVWVRTPAPASATVGSLLAERDLRSV